MQRHSSLLNKDCHPKVVHTRLTQTHKQTTYMQVFAVALAVHYGVAATARGRARFAALGLEQRLVTYQHLIFAIVFSIQLVPYTFLVVRFFFGKWTPEYMVGADDHVNDLGIIFGLMIISHAFLYCMEVGG